MVVKVEASPFIDTECSIKAKNELYNLSFDFSIVPIIEIFLKQKGGGLYEKDDNFKLFDPIFGTNRLGTRKV